jgi:hypothetical protein
MLRYLQRCKLAIEGTWLVEKSCRSTNEIDGVIFPSGERVFRVLCIASYRAGAGPQRGSPNDISKRRLLLVVSVPIITIDTNYLFRDVMKVFEVSRRE